MTQWKVLSTWRKGGCKKKHGNLSQSVRKQSCSLSVEIYVSVVQSQHLPQWWRWKNSGHFSKTIMQNTANATLNWFERENKAARMAQPISWLESIRKSTERTKDQRRGPRNLQHLKTVCVCVEEWAKITPEQCMWLVSPNRSHLEAVITSKGFCTKY